MLMFGHRLFVSRLYLHRGLTRLGIHQADTIEIYYLSAKEYSRTTNPGARNPCNLPKRTIL